MHIQVLRQQLVLISGKVLLIGNRGAGVILAQNKYIFHVFVHYFFAAIRSYD